MRPDWLAEMEASVPTIRALNERLAADSGRPPRVMFSGSRRNLGWEPGRQILSEEITEVAKARVAVLAPETLVIVGGAPFGIDVLVESLARNRGDLYVAVIEGLWDHLGKRAGFERNGVMASLLDPERDWVDALYACEHPRRTSGTHDAVLQAALLGIPRNEFWSDGGRAAEITTFSPEAVKRAKAAQEKLNAGQVELL